MVTREERKLSRFMFERYCAALANPTAATQDALANALRVAQRRVRRTLEGCFADENVEAEDRRKLLLAYGSLDRSVEGFWKALADRDPHWLERGSDLIRLIEHAHGLAVRCRTAAGRFASNAHVPETDPPASATEPGAPSATFEEEDTQVFERDTPKSVPATTQVSLFGGAKPSPGPFR